jgi:hypothetical protein
MFLPSYGFLLDLPAMKKFIVFFVVINIDVIGCVNCR